MAHYQITRADKSVPPAEYSTPENPPLNALWNWRKRDAHFPPFVFLFSLSDLIFARLLDYPSQIYYSTQDGSTDRSRLYAFAHADRL